MGYFQNQWGYDPNSLGVNTSTMMAPSSQYATMPGADYSSLAGFGQQDPFGQMTQPGAIVPQADQGGLGGWWSQNGSNVGSAIGAAGSLFNLYSGIKQLGLMTKSFKHGKKMDVGNFNNNVIAFNNENESRRNFSRNASLAGTTTGSATDLDDLNKYGT